MATSLKSDLAANRGTATIIWRFESEYVEYGRTRPDYAERN